MSLNTKKVYPLLGGQKDHLFVSLAAKQTCDWLNLFEGPEIRLV